MLPKSKTNDVLINDCVPHPNKFLSHFTNCNTRKKKFTKKCE